MNLQQLLQQVVASLDKKIKETGAVIHFGNLPTITGSQEMLYSLFYNLLDNTIKFQPAYNTPVIDITSAIVTEKRKEDLNFEEQLLCISVTDNGIGFNQEDADKLFTIFVRPAEGTPDKGATFRCFLPLEHAAE